MVNINVFRKFFGKKNLSDEYVDLSFGRVFFKKITNKMLTQIEILSKNNTKMYVSLFERAITDLSNYKIDNLFIEDANKLRRKVKDILISKKLLIVKEKIEEDKPNIFSKKDVDWFNKTKKQSLSRFNN